MQRTIAFSKAERVIISRGSIFCARRPCITAPTDAHSSCFSFDSAGKEDEPGRVIPKASAALAIVLAVYIWGGVSTSAERVSAVLTPPHAPGPGHAFRFVSYRSFSASGVLPAAKYLPYD